MNKRTGTAVITLGLLSSIFSASAAAQDGSDKKMSAHEMSGMKMSQKEATDKMAAMSADDKAAMYDKMSDKQKAAGMKMSGMKMSGKKMDHKGMGGMGNMSNQDKADMFDKMPMKDKMSMMNGAAGMHSSPKPMGKMDK